MNKLLGMGTIACALFVVGALLPARAQTDKSSIASSIAPEAHVGSAFESGHGQPDRPCPKNADSGGRVRGAPFKQHSHSADFRD
jgi:hypothetical protein